MIGCEEEELVYAACPGIKEKIIDIREGEKVDIESGMTL